MSRLVLVDVLVAVTTLLVVIGIYSVWANRLLFSPENWSHTSTQLLQNDKIRSTTANYVVDQLYANVNVAGLIRSGLPTRLAPLAAPAAGAIRNAAVEAVDTALTRPRVQALWAKANYAAAKTWIVIVKGRKGPVGVNQGVVSVDLSSVVDNVAARLGLPADLSAKLPPNVGNLQVLKSDQLKYLQVGGNAIRGLALWLTILAPILYGLAILLARGHRRRTLMTVGFAGIFAGILALVGRSVLDSQLTGALTNDASLKATISSVTMIMTGMLVEVAGAVIFVGAALVLAAWFAGPTGVCRSARRAIAPFLRERAVASYAIALGLMLLVFIWNPIPATGKPAGIIVFTLLAVLGMAVLRHQTVEEFPDARPGDATLAIRSRIHRMREARQAAPRPPRAPVTGPTTVDQLKQLAELRTQGALTPEEYDAAKSELLHV